MEFYQHRRTEEPSILVVFDLREPESWKSARDLKASWGTKRSRIHTLDSDHVILELIAGVAQNDAKESA